MSKQVNGNPKLVGSNIVDCVPQTGFCSNKCLECYYNNGFYRTIDEPLMPTLREVGNKLVRVNSGHDSNLNRDVVIEKTAKYSRKYYNTSIPYFEFPGPVMFTANGRDTDHTAHRIYHPNIMAVRFRVNPWNIILCDEVVNFYTVREIPVILTFMRYRLVENIKQVEHYKFKKSILNSYYCIKEGAYNEIVSRYIDNVYVLECGSYTIKFCKDCNRCEDVYLWHQKNRRS